MQPLPTMSYPVQSDEDEVEEVEFVSLEDKITYHKARVTSTLDRLAQQVAQDKTQRADKCRAFKEKQILQKAHGQQELAFSSAAGINQEAKRCVDMWLKMPGVKPGVVSSGPRRYRSASLPSNTSTSHACPVISCGRVFDNVSLLDGHLKRFDHSPCDPTVNLKGCPSERFACAACGQHFLTPEEWRKHLDSKVSSSTPDGHSVTQAFQRIVCFACPACYLFFNVRDECLQHMSAKNHFTESLTMSETNGRALPVPIPQYVKNRLIRLCKDVAFNVHCSLCRKVLISHQAAQAHFNVQCRNGCAVAKADKTVVEVMKGLQVRGQCSVCCKLFFHRAEIEKHRASTQHHVEVNQTMGKAVLQHCRFSEIQHAHEATESQSEKQSTGLETPQKRNNKRSNCSESPAKRQRISTSVNVGTGRIAAAWFCECGLQFSEEALASKHLLAANQVFHQCGVCGKHMGESSITRLHMSRFHGGAHLSNFLFYCNKCKVEIPRYEDVLSHLSQEHSKHTHLTEREVVQEPFVVTAAEPSTSHPQSSSTKCIVQQNAAEASPLKSEQSWMCRMCEDVFASEDDVHKHCSDVAGHSYQRFMCGHCPQKFFKESTVRRHCANEHGGQIKSYHFCGLCESMQFESKAEFLEHYKNLHSKDYYRIDGGEVVQPKVPESSGQPVCPCKGSEQSKKELKATYTQCMRALALEGKCQYACAPCEVTVPSYAQMKTHVHIKHPPLNLNKTFNIECKTCPESFTDVPSFHEHYHSQHCSLEPCMSSRTRSKDWKAEPTPVKIADAMDVSPVNSEVDDETMLDSVSSEQANKETEALDDELVEEMDEMSEEARESAELEEALQRSLLEF